MTALHTAIAVVAAVTIIAVNVLLIALCRISAQSSAQALVDHEEEVDSIQF